MPSLAKAIAVTILVGALCGLLAARHTATAWATGLAFGVAIAMVIFGAAATLAAAPRVLRLQRAGGPEAAWRRMLGEIYVSALVLVTGLALIVVFSAVL